MDTTTGGGSGSGGGGGNNRGDGNNGRSPPNHDAPQVGSGGSGVGLAASLLSAYRAHRFEVGAAAAGGPRAPSAADMFFNLSAGADGAVGEALPRGAAVGSGSEEEEEDPLEYLRRRAGASAQFPQPHRHASNAVYEDAVRIRRDDPELYADLASSGLLPPLPRAAPAGAARPRTPPRAGRTPAKGAGGGADDGAPPAARRRRHDSPPPPPPVA
jgi:hypothetical protein